MQAGVLQSQKQDLQSHTRRVLHEIITTDDSSKLDILYHTFNSLVDQLEEIRRSNVDRFSLLPTELLNQIFIYYCLGERPQEPFVLLLVCKHWLNVVTHCPDLWTRLFVSLDEVNWQECMEAYCHYSRDRPLDVTLEFPFSKEELNHIAAKGHVERWETLTIKSGSGTGSDMLNFPRRMREAPSVLYLLRSAEFPNLRNIDVRLKTAAAGSPMLWSNLFADTRSLDTVSVKHLLTSHLTVNLFFVDFPSLIDALKNLPGLVYLKFLAQRHPNVGATSGAQTAEDPIILPSLRELYMDQQPHGMTLLRRLDSPKLQRLSFRLSMQEIPVFYQAVQNISSLKSLHLILYDVPSVAQLEESPPLDLEVLTLTHLSPLSPTDFRYLLGDDSKRGMSLLTLLQLFSSAKKVNITTDQMSIQWYNIISIFQRAEELFMSKTKTTNTRKQAKASPYTGDTILLSRLLSLYLEGDLCDTALSMIHSPNLHRLKIVEAKDISPERLTDFVMRSSYLRSLHLEAVSSPQANLSDTKSLSESIRVGLTDLSVTHEAQKMIQNLEFTGLETLRLMGALQGVTMQRGIFHFDQREIHLKPFLSSTTSESPSIFANLVFLDLCVSNALFPVVSGLENVIPHLSQMEKISLPRALQSTDILVDLLIQSILSSDRNSQSLGEFCPHLEEIYTEDYPQWDCLTQLLLKRNPVLYLPDFKGVRALQCLRLPALPHPSILRPLQIAMRGMFPDRIGTESRDASAPGGCDDCALSGWYCLESDVNKDTRVRSQCDRHRHGAVRVTAYS